MDSPARFTRPVIAFAIVVPLAWAVLLWFHPDVNPDDVYGSLQDDVTAYLVVHVGTLVFIGLMGAALYLLVRDMPGTAARISRLAIGPFVVLYAAWEAVIGIAIGTMVQHGNDAPVSQQPAVADTIQSLGSSAIIGDAGVVGVLGALAWAVAVIAAAVAYRGAGAPALAWLLLAMSAVVASHPPPIGPIGLVFFAGAVALLARGERASRRIEVAAPVRASDAVAPA
jgi:hypothetical protein